MSDVEVTISGPLFDGRGEAEIRQACDKAEETVAGVGASMVQARLSRVLKTQTPYYRTRVVARADPPGWKVTDQGVIYGHWLEGTGSRNAPVTIFKGYHTFRIVTAELRGRAKIIVEGVISKLVARL